MTEAYDIFGKILPGAILINRIFYGFLITCFINNNANDRLFFFTKLKDFPILFLVTNSNAIIFNKKCGKLTITNNMMGIKQWDS